MIKENTKRTLVWLYPANTSERWLSKDRISMVLPELSFAGLRSLLYSLEKKQLILSQKTGGEIQYGLTTIGKALIETEMPSLKASPLDSPSWSVLVFLQPPATDRNFRYLRQLLIQHRWLSLSRGVFVFPAKPTDLILVTIQRLYPQSVIIMGISDWWWGDIRLVIGQSVGASQVDDIYSGVSREIERLIGNLLGEKKLDHQAKSQIVSVFDRLFSALKLDFTQVLIAKTNFVNGAELLSRLQLLG
jgi:DNA-binding transcriptional regulator PaaX